MGVSIQILDGHVESFNDLDLLLVMQLVIEALDGQEPRFKGSDFLVERWRKELGEAGPGTIDLHLESMKQEGVDWEGLALILDRVRQEWILSEDPIPARVLNARYRISGVRFGDYAIERITDTIDKICHLLRETRRLSR